jgi:hypothetical protein
VTERAGETGRLTDRVGIGVLTRVVPREVVDEVLAETGRREKRSRLLPAHFVVYFVMAMAVFSDGYEEVIRQLVGGLQFMRAWRKEWSVPTTGAISQARERLGEEPLKVLFERTAMPLAVSGAPGAWLGSRRLMAIDGVKFDVPDTQGNLAGFPMPGGLARHPFPQALVVGLGECGTHAVVSAQIGTLEAGERELAGKLAPSMGPGMLVIADRGFFSFSLWAEFMATGADLLFRLASPVKLAPLKILDDGSYISEIHSKSTRNAKWRIPLSAVSDPREATHIPVRVVEYTVTGAADEAAPEVFRIVTTVLDPDDLTAAELAAAYQERWEYEITLREIQNQMLESGGRLRSKSPELARQEIWGLLLAHFAIRKLIAEAAESAGIDPDRLSFIRSIRVARRQILDQAAFSPQEAGSRSRRDDERDPAEDQ